MTDWTKYGHEDGCTGTHYVSTITTRCDEHPKLNRILSSTTCHERKLKILRDRTLPDGSRVVTSITACAPVEQGDLFGGSA